jgi:uncharacterized protein (DUF885 family)
MKKIILFSVFFLFNSATSLADQISTKDYKKQLSEIVGNGELTANAQLSKLFSANWDYDLSHSPESSTFLGFKQNNHLWSDRSKAAIDDKYQSILATLAAMEKISQNELDEKSLLNYNLFKRTLLLNKEQHAFPEEALQLNQMGGPQRGIPSLLANMPTANVKDYENILARLEGIPALLEQVTVHMEKGLKDSVTPALITLADVPRQIESLIPEDPMKSPLLKSFIKINDSIPAKKQQQLKQQAIKIYTKKVKKAWQKLLTFVEKKYIPGARKNIAFSTIKDGKNWYAFRVKNYTTTNMTPEEIHKLGLSEVKRIRAEMAAIIKELEFAGSFQEFLDFLRTDPQFFYTTAKELLTEYRDIAKRVDAELPKVFSVLPRLPYGVKEIPANEAKAQTTAYYQQGSIRGGRSGTFYANTYALDTRPKWEMVALTLHEAMPGHHLQIALAQELEDVPEFRRNTWVTAFGEGWALYSEQLGYPMGMYKTPYDRFGQLTYEMWRAIRLVVDPGMHSLGWSRQQAIDFFKSNSSKSEHDIQVEIDRYIAWPGQALAYKIGQLTISRLRAKAEKQLGENFDLREFHRVVLENGSIPLDILEAHVNQWLSTQ